MKNVMDVLLRIRNENYLQECIKPETSDYFIMTDDGKNNVLGTDRWIGRFYTDNRDGLKESYALVPFFYIHDALRYSHYRCISYSSKEQALDVLERIKPKLIEYFGLINGLSKDYKRYFIWRIVMESKLKCPFCQQELREIYFNGVGVGYICPDPDCKKAEKLKGNSEFWQALIQVKQDLEVATKA